jgi:hypothetical protein
MRHAWAHTLQPAGGFHFYVAHPIKETWAPIGAGAPRGNPGVRATG